MMTMYPREHCHKILIILDILRTYMTIIKPQKNLTTPTSTPSGGLNISYKYNAADWAC